MKTVIEMAREAGFATSWTEAAGEALERFAELVRSDEREACAKVCEDIYNDPKGHDGYDCYYTRPYLECADAIRARGETK